MKRWLHIAFTILTLIIISSTTLYGGGKNRKKGTQLTFWHSMSIYQRDALERLVADYNESQDEVYVDLVFQGLYNEMKTKLIQAVQSGN